MFIHKCKVDLIAVDQICQSSNNVVQTINTVATNTVALCSYVEVVLCLVVKEPYLTNHVIHRLRRLNAYRAECTQNPNESPKVFPNPGMYQRIPKFQI